MLSNTANAMRRAPAQLSFQIFCNRAFNVRLTGFLRIVSLRFSLWSHPDSEVSSPVPLLTHHRRLTSIYLAYADVCNQPIPEQQLSIFQNITTYTDARGASSSTPEPALTKREADNGRCLFGLPEVVEMRYQWTQFAQSTGLQGLQPWPAILFVFVAGLCYAENRRSKCAGKA